MRVLLFAFTGDPSRNPHAPHNIIKNCLLYTGTHDNATTRSWLESEATGSERLRLFTYIGQKISPDQLPDLLIRLAMISIADTVIFPLQDILTPGAKARMTRPGTKSRQLQMAVKKRSDKSSCYKKPWRDDRTIQEN
jgi:4-alpha-glucanotransferase